MVNFRKILDKILGLFHAITQKIAKKHVHSRQKVLDPKTMRRVIIGAIAFMFVMFIATLIYKKGSFLGASSVIDHETPVGPRIKPDDVSNLSVKTFLKFDNGRAKDAIDCEDLLAGLESKGSMSAKDKEFFDKYCRDKLDPNVGKVIDKITSGEIPPSSAVALLGGLTKENAKAVAKALENEEVKRTLRGEAGADLAKNLGNLGNLSPEELEIIAAKVASTPEEFRQNILDAAEEVGKIQDKGARKDLIGSLAAARSRDEADTVRDFAETIAPMKGAEQAILAQAFTKAPNIETRRALRETAAEIAKLPPNDKVREKLLGLVKKASELPPDQQKSAYENIGKVAAAYREETDPDVKKALAEAIGNASDPAKVAALAKRLDDIKTAEETGPIDKKTRLAAIAGRDQTAKVLAAAADAVRRGDTDSAQKILSGKMPKEELARAIAGVESRPIGDQFSPPSGQFPPAENRKEDNASAQKLAELSKKKEGLEAERERLQKKMDEYMGMGIRAGDKVMMPIVKDLARVDADIEALDRTIADARARFKKKFEEFKSRLAPEYASFGAAMPDLKLTIPGEAEKDGAPPTRLMDLAESREFYADSGRGGKTLTRAIRLTTPEGKAGNAGGIMEEITGKERVWYVPTPGAGSAAVGSNRSEFKMSRILNIPGELWRIPSDGIASARAGQSTVLFKFLASVPDMRTGRIVIPRGSYGICKVKEVNKETKRLSGDCDAVDTGSGEEVRVSFTLGDATGADGVPAPIEDYRGWHLGGIFLTAFATSVLGGFSDLVVAPIEARETKRLQDYFTIGGATGVAAIGQDVAKEQIDEWKKASFFWMGHDGMIATIKQK